MGRLLPIPSALILPLSSDSFRFLRNYTVRYSVRYKDLGGTEQQLTIRQEGAKSSQRGCLLAAGDVPLMVPRFSMASMTTLCHSVLSLPALSVPYRAGLAGRQ